ncbi:hypothetical protein PAAG_04024 [Paracoccidioides lutzii Pb01]|uniref:Uncharacterized protein n=1 Tax=Paracoccidioides lutzii (strain ATCC MYA-826 / Pb01) TaxID=502779 RepID=C1GZT0_PARBA|nr:hypothetical protein PAAG_04024 [Paracoccidioides lutzii Pb01]EEH32971.1 hypothetical protein PAAG_04024 [Paracoccidioides lutzii Pb01]
MSFGLSPTDFIAVSKCMAGMATNHPRTDNDLGLSDQNIMQKKPNKHQYQRQQPEQQTQKRKIIVLHYGSEKNVSCSDLLSEPDSTASETPNGRYFSRRRESLALQLNNYRLRWLGYRNRNWGRG